MVKPDSLHVAIIPDGNRRWAKKRALQPWRGHEQAMDNSKKLVDWAYYDPRISTLTFWGFSTENWNRSRVEIKHLMAIYQRFLNEQGSELIAKQARFVHSGRSDRIPAPLRQQIQELEAATASFNQFTLNFALDYGGRDEIVRAIHRIQNVNDITEDSFRSFLDHPEIADIDIIIRTSGEQRLSNFFMWQGAYAELFFVQKLYPDLAPADVDATLVDYAKRQRRFGK